ncbi:MAG: hypothetical protein ACR2I5_03780 [Candidatus Limnocylindria bacterium]
MYERTGLSWHLPVLAVVGAAVGHAPGLVIGPSLDAAVFGLVGRLVTDGMVPYLDVWDHKPPLTYVTEAAAALGGSAQWPLIWLLSVAATAWVALLASVALRQILTPTTSAVLTFGAALLGGQYLLSLGGGLTEPLAAALAATAFVLALRAAQLSQWVLIGCVLGLALLASPQVAPAGPSVLLITLMRTERRVRNVAALLAGVAAIAATLVVALVAVGALDASIDAVLVFNAAYRNASDQALSPWGLVPWTVLALLPLIALAVIGMGRLRAVPEAKVPAAGAVVWIAGAIAAWAFQERFYAHYAIAVVFPFAALAGVGLHDIGAGLAASRGKLVGAAAVAVLVISVPVAVVGAFQEARSWAVMNERSAAVAAAVSARTRPGDSIFVWGNAPWVYDLADRAPASRFIYLLPLVTPGYARPSLIATVVEGLAKRLPTVVVATESQDAVVGFPTLDSDLGHSGSDALRALQPLQSYIHGHYRRAATVDGWSVLVRISDAEGASTP